MEENFKILNDKIEYMTIKKTNSIQENLNVLYEIF